jgi:hypothetical protein
MFFTTQVAVCVVLMGYLWQRQAYLHRRNRQTWEFLTAELQQYPADARNPWTRLQSARVAMEMADYAERNGDPDSLTSGLADLRRDAMESRVASFKAMLGSA